MGKGNLLLVGLIALCVTASGASEEVATPVAAGFDYPVGKPNAAGYYKARGFVPNGHLGEDWDGVRGGNSDLGDPVYSVADGVVVFARDVEMGWGNVVLVRHAFFEAGRMEYVDSLYGHVNEIFVKEGEIVSRGERIATIGNAHGLYPAHLHFEIHKNLGIGINHASCARDFSNYYDPTEFIEAHRSIREGPRTTLIALNFPRASDYAAPSGGTEMAGAGARIASVQVKPRRPFRVDEFRYSELTQQLKEDLD